MPSPGYMLALTLDWIIKSTPLGRYWRRISSKVA